MMNEDAIRSKMADPVELTKLREAEQKNLTTSQVPITAAMMEIAKGRSEQGGPELIAPQLTTPEDVGPLTGWNKLPRTFDVPPTPAPTAAPPPTPMATTDGGVTGNAGGKDAGGGRRR
jgi:hypothetical protein